MHVIIHNGFFPIYLEIIRLFYFNSENTLPMIFFFSP